MEVTVNQIRENKLISSIEMNLPDDFDYICEIHLCLQRQSPESQINFYWGNNFILGKTAKQVVEERKHRLKIYNHKYKVAV